MKYVQTNPSIVFRSLLSMENTLSRIGLGDFIGNAEQPAHGRINQLSEYAYRHTFHIKTFCKDCGAETEPGSGSARCPSCWDDKCGGPWD